MSDTVSLARDRLGAPVARPRRYPRSHLAGYAARRCLERDLEAFARRSPWRLCYPRHSLSCSVTPPHGADFLRKDVSDNTAPSSSLFVPKRKICDSRRARGPNVGSMRCRLRSLLASRFGSADANAWTVFRRADEFDAGGLKASSHCIDRTGV